MTKHIFALALFLVTPVSAQEKKALLPPPDFVTVPKVSNRINEDSIYADIINRSRNPFLTDTRATNAHETTHLINADLGNATMSRLNGFYVRNGRGVYITEPRVRLAEVSRYLPLSLRSSKYNLYFVQQAGYYHSKPNYILNEGIAYWNDCCVNVEDVKKGRWRSRQSDGISGCVDYSIYTIALCMAVQKHDPAFWNENNQFRRFVVWYLKGAEATYKEGSVYRQLNQFQEQLTLLHTLRTAPEAAAMRAFIKNNLEGVWLLP